MAGFVWKCRTLGMFVVMSAILMGIGALIGSLFQGRAFIGMSIMLGISILMCLISYFFSKEMALRANHARIVTEAEYPELYSIVREVAQAGDLPMPEVGVCNTDMANAFATGRNPNNAAVVVTTGIMNLLPRDELKGVIAHEMSHVKNRDILVMSIASTLSTIISYVASMFWWIAFVNSLDRRNEEGLVILIIAYAVQILVPFAAILVQLGISRNREFLADETGARMINDPRALARALYHISGGGTDSTVSVDSGYRTEGQRREKGPADNYSCAHMWISNPLKEESLIGKLFSTHPPMKERIDRLNKLADELGL